VQEESTEFLKMVKVLLINPPFEQPITSKRRCLVPLGLAYIAAYLRSHGVEVKIFDCVMEGYGAGHCEHPEGRIVHGVTYAGIKGVIEDYMPDFVGVSCMMLSAHRYTGVEVCRVAKEVNSNIQTVVGGAHASTFSSELIQNKYVDHVVVGEGEAAMLDIVRGDISGIVQYSTLDIDEIPWPARDLLPIEEYLDIDMPEDIFSPNHRVTQVLTSRGCPFNCVFCSTTNVHGLWRGRDPINVLDEIDHLIDMYRVDEINFLDENLVLQKSRTLQLMEGLIGKGVAWSNPGGILIDGLDEKLLEVMKKAGCYKLTFPVETSNKDILKNVIDKPLKIDRVPRLVKKCHKLGIDVHAFFVCGFPQQSKDDMIRDYRFAKKCGFDSASFHILTPLPGSRLWEEYKDVVDVDTMNYITASIPHPTMSADEIGELVNSFNVKFNKSYKWRHPFKWYKKYVKIARERGLENVYRRV